MKKRLGALETDAAQFDAPTQGVLELNQRAAEMRRELVELLEKIPERIKK